MTHAGYEDARAIIHNATTYLVANHADCEQQRRMCLIRLRETPEGHLEQARAAVPVPRVVVAAGGGVLDVVVIRAPRAGWRVGLQPRRSIKPCSGQVAVSADREELVAVRVWWRAIPVILAAGPMLRAYSSPTPRVLVRVHCVYSRALLLITAAARGATMFVGGRGVRFLRASNIIGSSRDISRRLTGVLLL